MESTKNLDTRVRLERRPSFIPNSTQGLDKNLGHWEWNLGDNELFWSKGARELLDIGGTRGTPPLSKVFAKIHHDDRGQVESAMSMCLLEGSNVAEEFRVIRSDGTSRWLMILASAQTESPTGPPVRVVGIVKDITERRLARAAIIRSTGRGESMASTGIAAPVEIG